MHRKTAPAAPFFLISAPSALKSPVSSGGLRPPKYFLNLGNFPQFQSRRAGEQKKTYMKRRSPVILKVQGPLTKLGRSLNSAP